MIIQRHLFPWSDVSTGKDAYAKHPAHCPSLDVRVRLAAVVHQRAQRRRPAAVQRPPFLVRHHRVCAAPLLLARRPQPPIGLLSTNQLAPALHDELVAL